MLDKKEVESIDLSNPGIIKNPYKQFYGILVYD